MKWTYFLVGLSFLAGLILSILSWLEVCVEHCAANQDYRLFGSSFAIFGIAFFTVLLALHIFSYFYRFLSQYVGWLISAALGAECMFIAVQKYQIGHWCPVCLSIAASVLVAACALGVSYLYNFSQTLKYQRGAPMQQIKRGLTSLIFVAVGFLTAFIGISNPNSAEAASERMKERLAFGLKDSPIEVYYITDWFCPSCKKIEPLMEKLYPSIRAHATFYFVDFAIHKKSMNFSPYNLSFLINNKGQYFKARQILSDLTDKTETPNDEEVEREAHKKGIHYQELSFVDVKAGMDFFDKISDQYKLTATPTLIFTRPNNHQMIKLEGREEITEEKVLIALHQLANQ